MMFLFCSQGVTGMGYWFGFRVSFDTHEVLCLVLEYRLILIMFYLLCQDIV